MAIPSLLAEHVNTPSRFIRANHYQMVQITGHVDADVRVRGRPGLHRAACAGTIGRDFLLARNLHARGQRSHGMDEGLGGTVSLKMLARQARTYRLITMTAFASP